jgi:hypothetical protein
MVAHKSHVTSVANERGQKNLHPHEQSSRVEKEIPSEPGLSTVTLPIPSGEGPSAQANAAVDDASDRLPHLDDLIMSVSL